MMTVGGEGLCQGDGWVILSFVPLGSCKCEMVFGRLGRCLGV